VKSLARVLDSVRVDGLCTVIDESDFHAVLVHHFHSCKATVSVFCGWGPIELKSTRRNVIKVTFIVSCKMSSSYDEVVDLLSFFSEMLHVVIVTIDVGCHLVLLQKRFQLGHQVLSWTMLSNRPNWVMSTHQYPVCSGVL